MRLAKSAKAVAVGSARSGSFFSQPVPEPSKVPATPKRMILRLRCSRDTLVLLGYARSNHWVEDGHTPPGLLLLTVVSLLNPILDRARDSVDGEKSDGSFDMPTVIVP